MTVEVHFPGGNIAFVAAVSTCLTEFIDSFIKLFAIESNNMHRVISWSIEVVFTREPDGRVFTIQPFNC
jgi:hypothetical protein